MSRARHPWPRLWWLAAAAAVLAGTGTLVGAAPSEGPPVSISGAAAPAAAWSFVRVPDPDRTMVVDASGSAIVSLTDGARTAAFAGPERTLTDPDAPVPIRTSVWVRTLPEPWGPGAEARPWFPGWLLGAARDTTPDVIAAALDYTGGSVTLADGTRSSAPGGPRGTGPGHVADADFHDYLGVPWTFADGRIEPPEPTRGGGLDAAGYLRLVWGYRSGLAVGADVGGSGTVAALPRRARDLAESGPGTTVIPDRGRSAAEYSRLQAGDLVFFDTDPAIDDAIDHSGIYLGVDDGGRHRFVSSRAGADGPTFGDVGETSVLDDGRFYSQAFRAARRL